MEKIITILSVCRNKGISLSLDDTGTQLKLKGNTKELSLIEQEEIKECKQDIILFLLKARATAFVNINPVPEQRNYVLSSGQRRLWMQSQISESSIAYNMSEVHVFEGELDYGGLEFAFNALLERHESLRTVFRLDENGEIRQYILSPKESGFRVNYYDMRGEPARYHLVKALIQQDIATPFDLANGPLLRATLYHTENNYWVFSNPMHHIISDGWSMGILFRELLLFYQTYTESGSNPVPKLRIQYRDYATWQQELLKNGELDIHKQYWVERFAGELPILELPSDKLRPSVKTYEGGLVKDCLDKDIVDNLRILSRQQGVTLFMNLLAAVKVLLYRYTQQSDIIIGSPIAGRDHIDLENQIGFYVNMLPLRTRFTGDNSYMELLEMVKKTTLEAYEHQAYPFDELVEMLQLHRDRSRMPLFDVVVVLQNLPGSGKKLMLNKLEIGPYEDEQHPFSRYDISIYFSEVEEELQMLVEYNVNILKKEAIIAMIGHFKQLVASILKEPGISIDKLDYLSEREKLQIQHSFNKKEKEYPVNKTVVDLFNQQVSRSPDDIALVFNNEKITYREVADRSDKLANLILDKIK